MANLNGMGPNNRASLTGRARGNCRQNNGIAAKLGAGISMGLGLAWGYRRGIRHFKSTDSNTYPMGRGFRNGLRSRFKDINQDKES